MRWMHVRFALVLVVAFAFQTTFAHDWRELDVRRVLDEAEAVVAVAEAVQGVWAPARGAAAEPAGAPPELRWWTWVQQRRAEGGDDEVMAAVAALAPEWFERGDPPEVVADWWANALGELLAHAAARGVDDDARAAAMADLRSVDLEPSAAARASWIALLPVLTDVERHDLAPAFARLDALVVAVAP